MKHLTIKFIILLFFLVLLSCSSSDGLKYQATEKTPLLDTVMHWHHKDYELDKIPGISLERFYNENTQKPKAKSIIVATIDTQIDKNHSELKNAIWTNPNELPDNGIDDDHNGYIDDIHGWNFLGNKGGGYVVWANYEYVRIIRKYDPIFKNKNLDEVNENQKNEFLEYKRAIDVYKKNYEQSTIYLATFKFLKEKMPIIKDSLNNYFKSDTYTLEQLDSLKNKYKTNDKSFRQRRLDNDMDITSVSIYMYYAKYYGYDNSEYLSDRIIKYDSLIQKSLNVEFNERLSLGNTNDSLEKGHGNNNNIGNKIPNHSPLSDHNTEVSGVIAGLRADNTGIYGFSDRIKIMPLAISASGDEHDKDIAMAIYYAVDNGAKIINMSIGKEFSLHKEWVFEALKYAEKNNVLVLHSAGNDSFDIDINPYYPSDNDYTGAPEVVNNFICVGSISRKADDYFVSYFSNFGKQHVDIFAPGDDIYTIRPENTFITDGGTSLAAPMVSGTAALLWLYYPNLALQEIKNIILSSGSVYNIDVNVPGTENVKAPFSSLSKSGKVLNVYNAMKMAKEIVAKKK